MGQRWFAVSLQNLKVRQMNVRRVWSAKEKQSSLVAEAPEFNLVERNLSVAPIRVEAFAVQGPHNRRYSLTRVKGGVENPASLIHVLAAVEETRGGKGKGIFLMVPFFFSKIKHTKVGRT